MKKTIWLVLSISIISIMMVAAGCNDKAGPSPTGKASADSSDPKLAAIKADMAKTTPDGKAMIEKCKAMKPQLNEQASSKTLAEVIDDWSKNKGEYNITEIGWEAAQKKSGRWKIIYHYRPYTKEYLAAEWEYNPQNNTLYPFDLNNAPQFWAGPSDDDKKAKKGK
jgi:hypothetical protein